MRVILFSKTLIVLGVSLTTLSHAEHCANYVPNQKRVFWGDLHVHSAYSLDALGYGSRNNPEDAYAFARKQKAITLSNGVVTEIDRPLDFTAVTEHSEWLGLTDLCRNTKRPDLKVYCNMIMLAFKPNTGDIIQKVGKGGKKGTGEKNHCGPYNKQCSAATESVWQDLQRTSSAANDPCTFTTFQGYEWTGNAFDPAPSANGKALVWNHRNILFANDNVPDEVFDSVKYPRPEDLWRSLAERCNESTSCDVISIPHSSNASNGAMFDIENASPADLVRRNRYERLIEVMQHKGNSECLTVNSDDAVCDNFEIVLTSAQADDKAAAAQGYIQAGLKKGLRYEASLGLNPLRYGFVGGTDTHNATPGNVAENRWPGHKEIFDFTPKRRLNGGSKEGPSANRYLNPGAITGIWAEENTREALFAALKRRETYATSGPRITVRVLQTWSKDDLCAEATDRAAIPMGGTMSPPPTPGARPRFVVQALKDERNLERIELVKITASGATSVLKQSAKNHDGGESNLCAIFEDPTYRANEPALWYARVYEEPSPRWTFYDCQRVCAGNDACKSACPVDLIQERAWTSPIFSSAL